MRRTRQAHVARTPAAVGEGRRLQRFLQGNLRARFNQPDVDVIRVQSRQRIVQAPQQVSTTSRAHPGTLRSTTHPAAPRKNHAVPAHRCHGLGHDIHSHPVAVRGRALEEGTTRVDEMREHLESLGRVSVAPPREGPQADWGQEKAAASALLRVHEH